MNDNNDRFDNSMSDLEGFLGGYDSYSSNTDHGFNYGSTYNSGPNSRGYSSGNNNGSNSYSNNQVFDSGFQQSDTLNNYGQKKLRDEYVPVQNRYNNSDYGSMDKSNVSDGAYLQNNNSYDSRANGSQFNMNNSFYNRNGFENTYTDSSSSTNKKNNHIFLGALIIFFPLLMVLVVLCIIFGPTINSFFHTIDLKNNGELVTAYAEGKLANGDVMVTYEYDGVTYVNKTEGHYSERAPIKIFVNKNNPKDIIPYDSDYNPYPALITFVAIVSLLVIVPIVAFFRGKKGKGMDGRKDYSDDSGGLSNNIFID